MMSVCMSAREHISETRCPKFAKFSMLPVAVDRSFSGGFAIRYVLPICWWRHAHILPGKGDSNANTALGRLKATDQESVLEEMFDVYDRLILIALPINVNVSVNIVHLYSA